ncbi:MAG: glycosyltransferase family 2 protein [Acidimicrobiales bacterium]
MNPTPVDSSDPVVVFMPARNEALTVAQVLDRVPALIAGHRVERLVIDDSSTDGTAEAARRAGARVVRLEAPGGLGAAVRQGLAEARALGPAAVVFCDADGEYDPAESDRLVAPILEGRADYVIGSRFSGDIGRMQRRRRAGNRVLTVALSRLAGQHLTDGQSGFRALSGPAAAAAVINHDYNYAQVLTLDLLAKGFRYAEVPISYSFRTQGRSFVRLVPYLAHVAPAVWRMRRNGARTPVSPPPHENGSHPGPGPSVGGQGSAPAPRSRR